MKAREYNPEEYIAFLERVEEILESFDYPEMVMGFDELAVATSMSKTTFTFYCAGESAMMCAICIWSFTLQHQVIPAAAQATKH